MILISPTAGEGSPEDERYWLQTSDHSKQVTLEGGMDVIETRADEIADEVFSLVDGSTKPSPSAAS